MGGAATQRNATNHRPVRTCTSTPSCNSHIHTYTPVDGRAHIQASLEGVVDFSRFSLDRVGTSVLQVTNAGAAGVSRIFMPSPHRWRALATGLVMGSSSWQLSRFSSTGHAAMLLPCTCIPSTTQLASTNLTACHGATGLSQSTALPSPVCSLVWPAMASDALISWLTCNAHGADEDTTNKALSCCGNSSATTWTGPIGHSEVLTISGCRPRGGGTRCAGLCHPCPQHRFSGVVYYVHVHWLPLALNDDLFMGQL